jgi:hypothetical protein
MVVFILKKQVFFRMNVKGVNHITNECTHLLMYNAIVLSIIHSLKSFIDLFIKINK